MRQTKPRINLFPNARFPWRTFSLSFEMIPCIVLVCVGLWLMLPFETMTTTSPMLGFMVRVLPEWLWGITFLIPGLFQLRVLWLGPLKVRKAAALCAFVFLLFLLILALMESSYSLLIPVLSVLAFFEAVTVRRLKNSITVIECIAQKEQALCSN